MKRAVKKRIVLGYDMDDPEQSKLLMKKVTDEMMSGKSLKDALQLGAAEVEGTYHLAYSKYREGKYKEAIDLFRFLVMLDPKSYRYTFGLAAASHMDKNYLGAIGVYLMATLINPKDPAPFYYAADCYEKTGNLRGAVEAWDMGIRLAETDSKSDRALLERAKMVRKTLHEQEQKIAKADREKK